MADDERDKKEKVENLLAVLRGEAPMRPPEPEPPPLEAPPPMEAPAAEGEAPPLMMAPAADLGPIEARIAELEAKLEQMAAPPALEAPPEGEAAPEPPPPEPPQPPTELSLFLQTRMELMEKRLEIAQQEALRANLLLREREEAQRKAQREVEDLFRGIREQQRAASWDQALRKQYSTALKRIQDLQIRLSMAEVRMIPADEVLRLLRSEEGRAELEEKLRLQLAETQQQGEQAAGRRPPAPPSAETIEGAPPAAGEEGGTPRVEPGPGGLEPPPGLETLAAVMGRVADLERRLEHTEKLRQEEREARRLWEENILEAMKTTRRQWQKTGGPGLMVEATLESMVDSLKARDAVQAEMNRAVESLRDEPPDSPRIPRMRALLAENRKRMEELQERLDKQMAVVRAWVARSIERKDTED